MGPAAINLNNRCLTNLMRALGEDSPCARSQQDFFTMAFFSFSLSLARLLPGAAVAAAGVAATLALAPTASAADLRVGVSAGPYGQVLDEAARLAAEQEIGRASCRGRGEIWGRGGS